MPDPEVKVTPSADPQPDLAETVSKAVAASITAALPAAMKPLVDQISESGRIVRQPFAVVPDEVDESDIFDAMESGDKQKASQLLRRARAADRARLEREVVGPLREQGTQALSAVAKVGADQLPNYKRFQKEIDEEIAKFRQANPGAVVLPDHYRVAHDMVSGRHVAELVQEAQEKAIRQAAEREAGGALEPAERARLEKEPHEPESLQEALVGNWKQEFAVKQRSVGRRSDDDEVFRLGMRGGVKEFLKVRKEMQTIEEETAGTFGLDADYDKKTGAWINDGRANV